jgi:hypothetical protein
MLLAIHDQNKFFIFKKTNWTESAIDLYRPSDHRFVGEVSANFLLIEGVA